MKPISSGSWLVARSLRSRLPAHISSPCPHIVTPPSIHLQDFSD
jgi:hypothetical protein